MPLPPVQGAIRIIDAAFGGWDRGMGLLLQRRRQHQAITSDSCTTGTALEMQQGTEVQAAEVLSHPSSPLEDRSAWQLGCMK